MDPNQLNAIFLHNPAWKRFASYKEIPIIAQSMLPNEPVSDVGFGLYEDHNGLVVVTNRRVIFGGRKVGSLLKHTKTEIFDFSRITSVQVNGSSLLSTLIIVTAGARGEIKSMRTEDCRRIATTIQQTMARLSAPPVAQLVAPPPVAPSMSDEIQRLGALHAQGLLSDAEFIAAKGKILGTLP